MSGEDSGLHPALTPDVHQRQQTYGDGGGKEERQAQKLAEHAVVDATVDHADMAVVDVVLAFLTGNVRHRFTAVDVCRRQQKHGHKHHGEYPCKKHLALPRTFHAAKIRLFAAICHIFLLFLQEIVLSHSFLHQSITFLHINASFSYHEIS